MWKSIVTWKCATRWCGQCAGSIISTRTRYKLKASTPALFWEWQLIIRVTRTSRSLGSPPGPNFWRALDFCQSLNLMLDTISWRWKSKSTSSSSLWSHAHARAKAGPSISFCATPNSGVLTTRQLGGFFGVHVFCTSVLFMLHIFE